MPDSAASAATDSRPSARALAARLRLPFAQPPLDPDPAAVALVDRELARRLRVLPLQVRAGRIRVAMADPLNAAAIDDLQFQTGRRVEPVVTDPAEVDRALGVAYSARTVEALLDRIGPPAAAAGTSSSPGAGGVEFDPEVEDASSGEGGAGDDLDALRRASEAPPVVGLVRLLLERAVGARASDLHIEPAERGLRVRGRVDGQLRILLELPAHLGPAVVSRIKIMSGLDIALKRLPQDGRASIRIRGERRSLRVSTLPAAGGEKVVIRLLDSEDAGRGLEAVGLSESDEGRLRQLLVRSHGAILVTGPTGSGKTTTLYAILEELDRVRRNVVTLEDPIEYRLSGLTQVQVHARAGLTFATALRAVLRQDPDAVMVGEMRDRETVEVGLAAALTGHLVLSTLHTNDAASAVARLVEMGAAPYLVAGGLIGVVGQRLARRLCLECRRPARPESDDLRELDLPPDLTEIYRPGGCRRCDDSGYRGRVGIFEILLVDGALREAILRGEGTDALREGALAGGMVPMSYDAWNKVRAGVTSVDEVRPLLALIAAEAPVCVGCGAGVRAAFVVCPKCGRSLRRRCTCGARLKVGWRWCPVCARPADPVDQSDTDAGADPRTTPAGPRRRWSGGGRVPASASARSSSGSAEKGSDRKDDSARS